ncbi:hypothetical protein AVEN_175839-1 [Araneus ventricosus]|uniref:Uncharacterized protein n=1 Tax=Araneus ventricosus TaxID=182803 RepID=A0A4Y2QDW3_ARAVE|nr:hypothetical protein AVEN_175839-1 [Araneus ventricosus]
MLKIEGVKCIFIWFATPKIVARHNAEEKRECHTPEHPLSWQSVSVRDYNTRGSRSSDQQYIRDTFKQQVIGHGGCVEWPPRSPDLNPLDFFCGDTSNSECMQPSTNITGTSKPYYGCLCKRVTCHVVQCAAGSAVPCSDVYCC